MRIPRGALPVAALTCSILLGACGGGSAPSGATSDPETTDATVDEVLAGLPSDFALPGLDATYESVTLAPDTSVVDKATIKRDLRSVDSRDDGATLRFAGDSEVARSLSPGQVVSFETIGIGRVETVGEDGGEILVTASAAPLSDFISDGVVAWSAPISFDDIPEEAYAQAAASEGFKVASVSDGPPGFAPELAIKGKGLSFKGKIKGFNVAYSLTPTPDKLKFAIVAERHNVRITAKGFVTSFVQEARLEFDSGQAILVDASVRGMRGEAEIDWAAFQVDNEEFDRTVVGWQMPLAIPFPFAIGPVPMTLSLKAALRVVPAFEMTQAKGSSGGSFRMTYDSDQGFSAKAGAAHPAFKVSEFFADLGEKETVTAGLGPVGFALGVEFPRVELALGHPVAAGLFQTYAFVTLNQYANGQFTPGTTLSSDIPPCQRASFHVSAIAGYKFAVLGMVQISDNTMLWEKTVDKFKDNKPCTLTGE